MSASCIYEGVVRHRRNTPRHHEFDFRFFMLMLDLDELDQVFAGRWFWSAHARSFARFRSEDHLVEFSNVGNLRERVICALRAAGFEKQIGAVRLLDPTSIPGLFDETRSAFSIATIRRTTRVEAVIAEVNNTPWGEQHLYVIPAGANHRRSSFSADQIDKIFHVSPFMPMEMQYRMAFFNSW